MILCDCCGRHIFEGESYGSRQVVHRQFTVQAEHGKVLKTEEWCTACDVGLTHVYTQIRQKAMAAVEAEQQQAKIQYQLERRRQHANHQPATVWDLAGKSRT